MLYWAINYQINLLQPTSFYDQLIAKLESLVKTNAA